VSATIVGDATERDIRIETRDVIAVFTNRGARLKSWRLKKYRDQQQQPQELIENQPTYPLPFTLRTADEQLNTTLNESIYFASTIPTTVITAPTDLRFEYRNEAGIRALKEFHLIPDSYIIEFRADVAAGDRAVAPAVVWGPAVGDIAEVSRYTQKAEGFFFMSAAQRLSRTSPTAVRRRVPFCRRGRQLFDRRAADGRDHDYLSGCRFRAPSGTPARSGFVHRAQRRNAGQVLRRAQSFDVLAALGPMSRARSTRDVCRHRRPAAQIAQMGRGYV
jgi:YidC/Oxa1 family membrane protein insertase